MILEFFIEFEYVNPQSNKEYKKYQERKDWVNTYAIHLFEIMLKHSCNEF
jgi:hypothetical protein